MADPEIDMPAVVPNVRLVWTPPDMVPRLERALAALPELETGTLKVEIPEVAAVAVTGLFKKEALLDGEEELLLTNPLEGLNGGDDKVPELLPDAADPEVTETLAGEVVVRMEVFAILLELENLDIVCPVIVLVTVVKPTRTVLIKICVVSVRSYAVITRVLPISI